MDVKLETLLPHREPMILIDEVVSFSAAENSVVCKVTIGPGQLFFEPGGVPGWVAIEYMAQTAAALAGLQDRAQSREVRMGFLLGTRRLELGLEKFAEGRVYHISGKCVFDDGEAAVFECAITDENGAEVARASLNACRPVNAEKLLKEQTAK